MKIAFSFLFTLLAFSACQQPKEISKIEGKDWLLGKWESNSDAGNLTESWVKLNDSIYNGECYFVKGNDTLHAEKMQLTQKAENLYYISNVKGENNDKPVTFGQNVEIVKQLVFENPKNEYPRKISYSTLPNNELQIQVAGKQQGKPSSSTYSMKKIE